MPQLTLQQAVNLAVEYQRNGQLGEADTVCRQILSQYHDHPDVLHLLGTIAWQAGRRESALDLLRRCIALNHNFPAAHANLGAYLGDMGRLDEAIFHQNQAIAQQPKFPQAYYNLANALRDKGWLNEAISAYRQAIALRPNYPGAYYNLANVLNSNRQPGEAIAAFRKAIAQNPNLTEAHNNLGTTLLDLGEADEAVAAYEQAIALNPKHARYHYNLGNAFRQLWRIDEAIVAYQRAITLAPALAEAYSNLGLALMAAAQPDEAITAFRRAIALRPGFTIAQSNLLYHLQFHPAYTAESIVQEHRLWGLNEAEPLTRLMLPHTNERSPDRRIKVGYVSPDFRAHCQSLFTVPLLANHDHERVEVFCYSNVTRPDAVTERIADLADVWRPTTGMSDNHLAEMLRADKVDVLVDLTMHMSGGRPLLFVHKPAPVQIAWLAYPGTTGLSAMDYRLTDPYLDPPAQHDGHYCEKSIRLPETFWCFDPTATENHANPDLPPKPGPSPAAKNGFVTFGCLNSPIKLNDGVLILWSRVLRATHRSKLILLVADGAMGLTTIQKLTKLGVEADRVELFHRQPRSTYLNAYQRVDIALDTLPYNGHTTSLDSMWMGVPVVTRVGATVAGRAGWSQLSNLSLTELAAHDDDSFVQIATDLANNSARLSELRRTLRNRMVVSPLMDARRFAKHRSGLPPRLAHMVRRAVKIASHA